MKLLFILLSITLINKDCSPKAEQENITIEYTASTRGSYLQTIVENDVISINQQRGGAPIIKGCPKEIWENLIIELKKIDVEQLQNFVVPSKKRQFDSAKIAFLKITKNNKTHQTKNFDHGNPPKEIAALVKEILSIAENIE